MGISLSDDIKELVDHPNFAHLATLMPDGSPHGAPVWIARESDLLMICTEASSLKGKNTQRDPRVAISIVDFGDPYSDARPRHRAASRPAAQVLRFDLAEVHRQAVALPRREVSCRSCNRDRQGQVLQAALRAHAALSIDSAFAKKWAGRRRVRPSGPCAQGESSVTCADCPSPQKIPGLHNIFCTAIWPYCTPRVGLTLSERNGTILKDFPRSNPQRTTVQAHRSRRKYGHGSGTTCL
jgi:hypothetical protein